MDDIEWATHQSSWQWKQRVEAGTKWKAGNKRKITNRYELAVQRAETAYKVALAKADQAKENALDELAEQETDRTNADIIATAIDLGIWK